MSIFLHFLPSIFHPVFVLSGSLPALLPEVPLFHHCSSFYPPPLPPPVLASIQYYAMALCVIQGVSDILFDLLTNRQLFV